LDLLRLAALVLGSFVVLGLAVCRPAARPKTAVAVAAPVESIRCVPLNKGETPLSALKRIGLNDSLRGAIAGNFARLDVGTQKCLAGESLIARYRNDRLYRFEYRRRYDQTYVLSLDSGRTQLASAYHDVRVRPTVYSGTIRNSLWGSMIRIGQKPDMIMRFADLFSWDVDFFTETQPGDSFKLITEQTFCDGRPIGNPLLIVGMYKGKVGEYYGLFYQDPSGRKDFYTQKGEAVRKSFLRSPLQFSRVSSSFSSGRYHPILRYVRPHQGVDYSARKGTPVSAIGDGIVTQAGWSGGYGNLVEINHRNGYRSRYGHLSRFGRVRRGGMVSQGTVIGYVGSTGMSTGPHLHFEVRVNGVPRNPLKLIPPRALPVTKAYLPQFRARADSLVALLHSVSATPEDKSAPVDSLTPDDSAGENGPGH
jgi:murein DD-endopeptidase MepM/ murein hydrolase activator NlpD